MPRGRDSSAGSEAATAVWQMMSELVLDNQRRKAVAEATGMSFARTRAIRRVAARPMSMSEFAAAMGIDPPNATVLVDELEAQGLVRRRQNPDDRRSKLVEATVKGAAVAARANAILETPPAALTELGERDLQTLRKILLEVAGPAGAQPSASRSRR